MRANKTKAAKLSFNKSRKAGAFLETYRLYVDSEDISDIIKEL